METIKSRKIQFSRFSQCCGESFYCISIIRGIMKKIMPGKITSLLLTLTLMVAALWVGPALAAEMVKDPTTGKMVVAPEYGGTITFATTRFGGVDHVDMWFHHHPGETVAGVLEKLGIMDWATPRDKFAFRTTYKPLSLYTGHLAESWEQPDPLTMVFKIRKGVKWQNKAPVNGREFTAFDAEYNYHRYTGKGSGFTEHSSYWSANVGKLESIKATDKYTLVFKQKEVDPLFLGAVLQLNFFYAPEVIKKYGDAKDWRNLVGTGPFEFTDRVEGTSQTWTKNPNYWDVDEKYSQNRLPYIDELKGLIVPEEVTRLSLLRSRKIDFLGMPAGYGQITSMDQVMSLKKTNPEIVLEPMSYRSETSWVFNTQKKPFDDVRVRHAMQMALDFREDGPFDRFHNDLADLTPQGFLGKGLLGYVTNFEEWPEEIKQYYVYDPEGAEKLLDEAGYPRGADGTRFSATMDYSLASNRLEHDQIAVEYWKKIGVEIKLEGVDGSGYGAKLQDGSGQFLAFISGYEVNPVGQMGQQATVVDSPWNVAQVKDPVYDAMYAAMTAAQTLEEQMRASKPIDMYMNNQHWFLWGARVPQFHAFQPWIVGYNGETELGDMDRILIMARLWIDSARKKEMGY